MPVPGPRNPFGQTLGDRNPLSETPDRFRAVPYHGIAWAGRSPGLMFATLRGCVLAAGQVRAMYRQMVNYWSPQEPFSWTSNGGDWPSSRPFGITRALRYLTRSTYVGAGVDNSRLTELHTVVLPRVRSKTPSVAGGSVRSRPTVRNRMTSFGSRVTPINDKQQQGAE